MSFVQDKTVTNSGMGANDALSSTLLTAFTSNSSNASANASSSCARGFGLFALLEATFTRILHTLDRSVLSPSPSRRGRRRVARGHEPERRALSARRGRRDRRRELRLQHVRAGVRDRFGRRVRAALRTRRHPTARPIARLEGAQLHPLYPHNIFTLSLSLSLSQAARLWALVKFIWSRVKFDCSTRIGLNYSYCHNQFSRTVQSVYGLFLAPCDKGTQSSRYDCY